MQPRARTSRSSNASPSDAAVATPPRDASTPPTWPAKARRGIAGCALGGLLLLSGCQARALPRATLAYRVDRTAGVDAHRLELRLSSALAPPASTSAPIELEPFLAGFDACARETPCQALDLFLDPVEREHLWVDPFDVDPDLDLRFDDVIAAPSEEAS